MWCLGAYCYRQILSFQLQLSTFDCSVSEVFGFPPLLAVENAECVFVWERGRGTWSPDFWSDFWFTRSPPATVLSSSESITQSVISAVIIVTSVGSTVKHLQWFGSNLTNIIVHFPYISMRGKKNQLSSRNWGSGQGVKTRTGLTAIINMEICKLLAFTFFEFTIWFKI